MISKNFTKYFQIPLYWLTLLIFFFLVSSLMPMLTSQAEQINTKFFGFSVRIFRV